MGLNSASKAFRACAKLLTAVAMVAGVKILDFNLSRSKPASPVSMGGYDENYSFINPLRDSNSELVTKWKDYKNEKSQLDKELSNCSKDPAKCSPHMKAFADMIGIVKAISDRKTQIEVINAFVNTAIDYDFKEAKENLPHRTLIGALRDGKGVCDEQAGLKLAALELTGFFQDDIRYVNVGFTKKGQQGDPHAVVMTRANGDNWILENWQLPDLNKLVTNRSFAKETFKLHSRIERDSIALTGTTSEILEKDVRLYPRFFLNNDQLGYYDNLDYKIKSSTGSFSRIPAPNFRDSLSATGNDRRINQIMKLAYSTRGINVENLPVLASQPLPLLHKPTPLVPIQKAKPSGKRPTPNS